MASLDDGKYNTMSSLSIVASRATIQTQDLTVSSVATIGGNLTVSGGINAVGGIQTAAQSIIADGTAIAPAYAFTSERSLGLYRSAASTIAQSYGTLDLRSANLAFSSGTTAQSASTAKVAQGQFVLSVLSLTTNGAAIYFRSGNSTYVWPSSGVIG